MVLIQKVLLVVIFFSFVSMLEATELKIEMQKMANNLSDTQMSFFNNNQEMVLISLLKLKNNINNVLGNDKKIIDFLPAKSKHKVSIASNSIRLIVRNIKKIENTMQDKTINVVSSKMRLQSAFLDIQAQCFRCHNLVREWR